MNVAMKSLKLLSVLSLACLLVISIGGCAKKNQGLEINPEYDDSASQRSSQTDDSTGDGTALPMIDQERLLFDSDTGLQVVYFDFDSYTLRPDARETLKRNADKIRQAPDVIIQIEGHCDERGTQEYNLALGEKRALAVREYLMNLGVSGGRMVTISYGEEDPADPGHDEGAWSKNRRCEFNKARR